MLPAQGPEFVANLLRGRALFLLHVLRFLPELITDLVALRVARRRGELVDQRLARGDHLVTRGVEFLEHRLHGCRIRRGIRVRGMLMGGAVHRAVLTGRAAGRSRRRAATAVTRLRLRLVLNLEAELLRVGRLRLVLSLRLVLGLSLDLETEVLRVRRLRLVLSLGLRLVLGLEAELLWVGGLRLVLSLRLVLGLNLQAQRLRRAGLSLGLRLILQPQRLWHRGLRLGLRLGLHLQPQRLRDHGLSLSLGLRLSLNFRLGLEGSTGRVLGLGRAIRALGVDAAGKRHCRGHAGELKN